MKVGFDIIVGSGDLRFEAYAERVDGSRVTVGASPNSIGEAVAFAIAQASTVGDPEGLMALALLSKFREMLGPATTSS